MDVLFILIPKCHSILNSDWSKVIDNISITAALTIVLTARKITYYIGVLALLLWGIGMVDAAHKRIKNHVLSAL